tara:strand:+ start:1556 stop:1759 length:204 start_codon:yes stop_codon:yes gene_type:complete
MRHWIEMTEDHDIDHYVTVTRCAGERYFVQLLENGDALVNAGRSIIPKEKFKLVSKTTATTEIWSDV